MKKLACVLALLSGLGCSRARPLTVGSKNFTEHIVLGEIVAQQLERRLGGKVDRKLDLGGTLRAQTARGARGRGARPKGMKPQTDAARRKQGWTLGVGYEFLQRPDGLAGLLQTYHLPLAGAPKSMDLGLLYSALEQKQVDMAAANATDGMLSVLDVKVLRDDRHYFPPYQAAVIVRAESLAGHPGLRAALDQLAATPPPAAMRDLNHQVDGKHRPVAEVARQWLATIR